MNWYKASRTVSGDLFCGKKERSSGWGERLAAIAPTGLFSNIEPTVSVTEDDLG
ncbi:MAG: hypothetical protein RMZ69_02035 [Nostoc sp. ChiQUE01a]|nr:hypothetical protein [Nostoc sp. ChiQUE01a]